MAMAENMVTRLQLIALRGSDANFLRLVTVANQVFQPEKNGKNGHGEGPFPAQFIRPPQSSAPPEEAAPPLASAPGSLFDANGQQYVE